jgi:hypothetical protein
MMENLLETITHRIADIDDPRVVSLHAMGYLIEYLESLGREPYEGHPGYWHRLPEVFRDTRKDIENALNELGAETLHE